MLKTVRIRNLALVEDLTLEFGPGFNVITGETGAGKSILLGALELVLGERADRSAIRAGAGQCLVEAVFELGDMPDSFQAALEESGIEAIEEGVLILKRTLSATGPSRQFINGSPATLQGLRQTGEWLVDVHGPHEHQSLLHPARQLAILDAFGGFEPARNAFAQAFERWQELQAQRTALAGDERTFTQQLDLLRYQVNEIQAAGLRPEEEPGLEEEYQRSLHAARLVQLAQTAQTWLNEADLSAVAVTGNIGRTLQELVRIDPSAAALLQLQEQSAALLLELQRELNDYADTLEIDPLRLAQLEERMNLVQALKRKYGPDLAAILAFGERAREELRRLETRDEELLRLEQQAAQSKQECLATGQELSRRRAEAIPELCRKVGRELQGLGFQQSRFEITLNRLETSETAPTRSHVSGFDAIEFQFAPNPGEPLLPLRSIASSGELARVMLALKTVLTEQDQIPVLVFDEVDANVGGETAQAVGERMRRIGQRRQVLCVTHLAPVAARADSHFLAEKKLRNGRSVSELRRLQRPERVQELARMLGGQSSTARRHAETLLR